MSPVAFLSVILLLCSALLVAARPRCESALGQVEAVLAVYSKENRVKAYPKTLKEFQSFAAKKGTPLNLSPFSEFTYKRDAFRKQYTILYTCKDTGLGGALGGAIITVH